MKLRNKKTGEIAEFAKGIVFNTGENYQSIKEVIEEWEDYEEPKEYWFLDSGGEVEETTYLTKNDKMKLRAFGNYFETKEEAEKVVEKLKAWKRLKDKGFYFKKWSRNQTGTIDIFCVWEGIPHNKCVRNDLDLLFGGEE